MDEDNPTIAGLIVAGGRSRRMGRDKSLVELGGRTLLARAVDRLKAGCVQVGVSVKTTGAVSDLAAQLGLMVIEDPPGLASGPLSGVLAGLRWAADLGAGGLVVLPCDAPFLPDDLPSRLAEALARAPCAMARTPDGAQPLCSAWRVSMTEVLKNALAEGRHPPVHALLTEAGCAEVAYGAGRAFLNINAAEDLAEAERLLSDPASRA